MQLRELLTQQFHVIRADSTIQQAAAMMRNLEIGILPVIERGQIIGTLTDRDITIRAIAEGEDPSKTYVSDIMTPGIVFCYEDEEIVDAAQMMEEQQIRRLIVLNRDDEPVGALSLGDIAIISESSTNSYWPDTGSVSLH